MLMKLPYPWTGRLQKHCERIKPCGGLMMLAGLAASGRTSGIRRIFHSVFLEQADGIMPICNRQGV